MSIEAVLFSAERLDYKEKKIYPEVYDAKMIKVRMRHANTMGKLTKHIFTVRDQQGRLERLTPSDFCNDLETEFVSFLTSDTH